MIYGYEDAITLFLAFIGFAITLIAQLGINGTYKKYKDVENKKRITGQEVARKILDENGLTTVHVVEVKGELSDHYDPSAQVVRLSTDIYHGETVAAMAVAAHECGHAIQDKVDYKFMKIRSSLVPIVNLISYLGYFTVIVSLIAGITGYLMIGILIILATLVFQLVTLPVEFDASRRALKELEKYQITSENEINGATTMLKAAAFTYVASVISSIMSLLRLVIMLLNNRKDD